MREHRDWRSAATVPRGALTVRSGEQPHGGLERRLSRDRRWIMERVRPRHPDLHRHPGDALAVTV